MLRSSRGLLSEIRLGLGLSVKVVILSFALLAVIKTIVEALIRLWVVSETDLVFSTV